MMFIPIWRRSAGGMSLVLRTTGDTAGLTLALRREIAAIDPVVPLLNVRSLATNVDQSIYAERLIATLSGSFGALALLISAVGTYGVILYAVTRRTREIGIRVALGAQRGSVLWLFFRDATAMVLIGTVIGTAASIAATRLVQRFLFGVGAQDADAMVFAAVVLGAAAVVACIAPARRATNVDPMIALRYE